MTLSQRRRILPALLVLTAGSSCGLNDFWDCQAPSEVLLARLPTRLSQTGLYQDIATESLAPGVSPFAP